MRSGADAFVLLNQRSAPSAPGAEHVLSPEVEGAMSRCAARHARRSWRGGPSFENAQSVQVRPALAEQAARRVVQTCIGENSRDSEVDIRRRRVH